MNFIFHILGILIPTDELIFCRGVGQPPSSIYITHLILLVMAISRRHFFSKFEGAIRCYPGPRMTPRQYRSWRHWPHVEQLQLIPWRKVFFDEDAGNVMTLQYMSKIWEHQKISTCWGLTFAINGGCNRCNVIFKYQRSFFCSLEFFGILSAVGI